MKNGRNDPCPCGSGKKYKKCCLESNSMVALFGALETLKREAKIKQCLNPVKSECSSTIIKDHAIQNNRILRKLAVDGCIMSMDGRSNLVFQDTQNKGRKVATTFSGFCSFHDKTLFQDIEDIDFIGTQKQVFLLTYRTLAWHYHKKKEQINSIVLLEDKMQQKGYSFPRPQGYCDLMNSYELAVEDNDAEKELFDKCLINADFEGISCQIWEIPYEIEFAISMMHGLEYDIDGNEINDYLVESPIKNIYLNIFPGDKKSYCVWSWLKNNDVSYMDFSRKFMMLSVEERKNYLNNQMPIWSDSIIVSPRLWNKWGDQIQQSLITHANFDVIYQAMAKENSMHTYRYMDTPWNFFEDV
ncbi:MAG: YecA family protein [Selenomonadaceae bacterium]